MNILIAGATSSIARAMARQYAAAGNRLYLAARREDEAARIASDLSIRYRCHAQSGYLDILDYGSHAVFIATAAESLGGLDLAVLAIGELIEQESARDDFTLAARMIDSNYTGCASFLNAAAKLLQKQGSGIIAGISSVAGERGRGSNYIYGSAKAGLTAYLSGLRNELSAKNVHVVTIKLGVVDTKMTYGMSRLLLPVPPELAAAGIIDAINRKRDIAFVPWFWWPIMSLICAIPEPLFKKMKL